jgi:hypothetical protein
MKWVTSLKKRFRNCRNRYRIKVF